MLATSPNSASRVDANRLEKGQIRAVDLEGWLDVTRLATGQLDPLWGLILKLAIDHQIDRPTRVANLIHGTGHIRRIDQGLGDRTPQVLQQSA